MYYRTHRVSHKKRIACYCGVCYLSMSCHLTVLSFCSTVDVTHPPLCKGLWVGTAQKSMFCVLQNVARCSRPVLLLFYGTLNSITVWVLERRASFHITHFCMLIIRQGSAPTLSAMSQIMSVGPASSNQIFTEHSKVTL